MKFLLDRISNIKQLRRHTLKYIGHINNASDEKIS